jgi:dTDP-glucose 4,6-dehydratase
MGKNFPKILVTGGAGFIGSEFVRQAIKRDYRITVIDKLTYSGDLERLQETTKKYKFYKVDICNKIKIESVFKREIPQTIVHFAAETHVDRSIVHASPFIETNIKGVQILLDFSRKYGVKKFIHISTDEVYGEIKRGKFSENSPLKPNNSYSVSKAAADLLIKSYIRTYGFPAIIIRPCNNFGPWQYPEKLISLAFLKALKGQKVPVYGKGKNVREWLYVSDCVKAILLIVEKGKVGEIYNVGSGREQMNIDVVKAILKILGKPVSLIEFVKDRPGHDFRYSLNTEKIKNELGWQARTEFEEGLRSTVQWYINNNRWISKYFSKKLSIKF